MGGYMEISKKEYRLGMEKLNNQGCLMKIVEYNNCRDIIVEFNDKYKCRVHTNYQSFEKGKVSNPYYPNVFEVGIIGNKYPATTNGKSTKEYSLWHNMIQRSYDKIEKKRHPAYENVTCCKEWLLYENFYEWLHGQSNFNRWYNGSGWDLDKDILIKRNKFYSPETCCLVPNNVNKLFTKRDSSRGNLPIGVRENEYGFLAQWNNPLTNKKENSKTYSTVSKAFAEYKKHKENIIKQVAQEEYSKGNITTECYNAMLNYVVEITD